jgi:hypothetical protein
LAEEDSVAATSAAVGSEASTAAVAADRQRSVLP